MATLSDNPSTALDLTLVSQVAQTLRGYDRALFSGVRVQSDLGVITLAGVVPSWYSKSLAYQLVNRHPHVSRVVDALNVTPPPRIR